MRIIFYIFGAICAVWFIWNFFFGESYREKRDEHLVWKYVEDNMFRLACVIDAISACSTVDELKSIEKWVNEKAEYLSTMIAAEAQAREHVSDIYTVKVAMGISQMIKEKYDEKLNSF